MNDNSLVSRFKKTFENIKQYIERSPPTTRTKRRADSDRSAVDASEPADTGFFERSTLQNGDSDLKKRKKTDNTFSTFDEYVLTPAKSIFSNILSQFSTSKQPERPARPYKYTPYKPPLTEQLQQRYAQDTESSLYPVTPFSGPNTNRRYVRSPRRMNGLSTPTSPSQLPPLASPSPHKTAKERMDEAEPTPLPTAVPTSAQTLQAKPSVASPSTALPTSGFVGFREPPPTPPPVPQFLAKYTSRYAPTPKPKSYTTAEVLSPILTTKPAHPLLHESRRLDEQDLFTSMLGASSTASKAAREAPEPTATSPVLLRSPRESWNYRYVDQSQDADASNTTISESSPRVRKDFHYDVAVRKATSGVAEWRKQIKEEEEQHRVEEINRKLEHLRLLSKKKQDEDAKETQEVQRRIKEKEEQERRAKQRVELRKLLLRPLTSEEEELVENTLDEGYDEDQVASGFDQQLTRADLRLLRDFEWLNDEVINFFIAVLQDRCKKNGDKPLKCHFFNTFFYFMLCNMNKGNGYNYQRVKKWTKQVDLFSMDKVLVPIHLGNHWCMAVINFVDKRFEYYDSLGGPNPECTKKLRQYLLDEAKDKGKTIDLSDWEDYSPSNIPHQRNGYDCGVFACKYADCVSQDLDFCFSQDNMRYFRKRMLLAILKQSTE